LSGEAKSYNVTERFWYLVLLLIGVSICIPKLLTPIRAEKQGYREAAEWLKGNTDSAATIAVPDKRISFYAERKGLVYEDGNIPANAVYIVGLSSDNNEIFSGFTEGKVVYKYVNGKNEKSGIVIYRK